MGKATRVECYLSTPSQSPIPLIRRSSKVSQDKGRKRKHTDWPISTLLQERNHIPNPASVDVPSSKVSRNIAWLVLAGAILGWARRGLIRMRLRVMRASAVLGLGTASSLKHLTCPVKVNRLLFTI